MLDKEIPEKLKEAMKAGRKTEVSALRMLLSEIKKRKIDDGKEELDDETATQIVQRMAKRHRESIEQFKKGGRDDLVKEETDQLAVIEAYLPKQMSQEELEGLVSGAIAETGASSPKDMGKVMGALMPKVKGKADGRLVSELVKKALAAIASQ